jgi:hypothetical protein
MQWMRWPSSELTKDGVARPQFYYSRSFGSSAEDLDIDFLALKRPALITAILTGCMRGPDGSAYPEDEIWDWTLQRRLQRLLAVTISGGTRSLPGTTRCPRSDCAEIMEIDVDLAIFQNSEEVAGFEWIPEAGHNFLIGLPTGTDQLSWLNAPADPTESLPLQMASTLVRRLDGAVPPENWRLPTAWLNTLSTELEHKDPLTALLLKTLCPACSEAVPVEFDLEGLLLEKLKEDQARMLEQIHQLASVYHWSEAKIMGLPAWRRRYYLSKVGVEVQG